MSADDAVYNAVCHSLRNTNVGEAIRSACHLDASHAIAMLQQEFSLAAYQMTRPSTIYRPSMLQGGNHWCAIYGENLHDGVAGFGKSPAEAMDAFDKAWNERLSTP